MKATDIARLQEFINVLRELYPDMSLNMVLTLLEVAKGHGVSGRDIEKVCSVSQAAASRNLRFLDTWQRAGKEGLDLVEVRNDPLDYRNKLRYLNANGEALMKRLEETMR